MATDDITGGTSTPSVTRPSREQTQAEIEALEDAEDIRISLERLKTEDSVSWESIKAKHGL